MKLTAVEKSWLNIFGVLTVIITAFFLAQPFLSAYQTGEPLADPAILEKLVQGEEVPVPDENPYAIFHGRQATPPSLSYLRIDVLKVLGTTSDEKRIEVDLTNQRVYAFEGSRKVYDFPTSTGKWGATPTGTFRVWTKIKSTLMHGGSGSTYYYLPNVPWVMFFGNNEVPASRGFSLHGTYWHNNFGHPMSHGCVNLRTEDAKVLFEWADPPTNPKAWSTTVSASSPGTPVVIYGVTPNE